MDEKIILDLFEALDARDALQNDAEIMEREGFEHVAIRYRALAEKFDEYADQLDL